MKPEKIAVMCPTKHRLQNAIRLKESYELTSNSKYSDLYFIIDDDDTNTYLDLDANKIVVPVGRRGIVDPMNRAYLQIKDKYSCILFMGDDHLFRTKEWDKLFLDIVQKKSGTCVVYANDLHQKQNLASSCLMTTNIIDILGYMYDPKFNHMWTDNYWMSIGSGLNRLVYTPDIIIEHMHPGAKKSEMDENYLAVTKLTQSDANAWEYWQRYDLYPTIEKIKKELNI